MNRTFFVILVAVLTAAFTLATETFASSSQPSAFTRNFSLFAGLDGSKQPQDLGINANMGARFAVDSGLPLWRSMGLGLHVGAGANFSDAAVHVLDQIEGTSRRSQYYGAAGLFQRTQRASWALGYDYQFNSYYDDFSLGQLRGQVGYAVTPNNELGFWGTSGVQSDSGLMSDTAVNLEPITQVNAFLRHTWPSHAWTSVWFGFADGHDNVVWVLPPDTRNSNVFVYGADLRVPLSDRFAMTGAANFLTPTSTGTVDAHLGLTFYPGGGVMSRKMDAFAPVQTAANNSTFSVDLTR
jgi:hypothetical protein